MSKEEIKDYLKKIDTLDSIELFEGTWKGWNDAAAIFTNKNRTGVNLLGCLNTHKDLFTGEILIATFWKEALPKETDLLVEEENGMIKISIIKKGDSNER